MSCIIRVLFKFIIQIIHIMQQRLNFFAQGQAAARAVYGLGIYLSKSSLEEQLLQLIYFRVSQINGCAMCLDMHSKDLRANGETEQRLYLLDAWRDAPFYTPRERAALAWAEAVTKITGGHVPEEVYENTLKEFSEEELIDLSMAVITINSYNRLNIAFRTTPGWYQPAKQTV